MITKIEEDLEHLEITGSLYDTMKHINYNKPNSIFQVQTNHIQDVVETIIYDYNIKISH